MLRYVALIKLCSLFDPRQLFLPGTTLIHPTTEKVMFSLLSIKCLFVCLSVCVSDGVQDNSESCGRIWMKV